MDKEPAVPLAFEIDTSQGANFANPPFGPYPEVRLELRWATPEGFVEGIKMKAVHVERFRELDFPGPRDQRFIRAFRRALEEVPYE